MIEPMRLMQMRRGPLPGAAFEDTLLRFYRLGASFPPHLLLRMRDASGGGGGGGVDEQQQRFERQHRIRRATRRLSTSRACRGSVLDEQQVRRSHSSSSATSNSKNTNNNNNNNNSSSCKTTGGGGSTAFIEMMSKRLAQMRIVSARAAAPTTTNVSNVAVDMEALRRQIVVERLLSLIDLPVVETLLAALDEMSDAEQCANNKENSPATATATTASLAILTQTYDLSKCDDVYVFIQIINSFFDPICSLQSNSENEKN